MKHNFLIAGHGLAGCVLALTFYRRGIPFQIAGITQQGEASMASSGLITPLTGRRYVKAWMIDDLIDKALDFYGWTENLLGSSYFFPVEIVRFLSNDEALAAWKKRTLDPEYVNYISDKKFDSPTILDKPYGILTGGYRLDTPSWLMDTRNFLLEKGLLTITDEPITEAFVENMSVIYATGAVGKSFSSGMIPNKGEALIVRLPGWSLHGIIKEKIYVIPLKEKNMFWVGSYYKPWPDNPYPSAEGRELLLNAIAEFYSGEIEMIDHLAGIRPTVDDRRPLVGQYPNHSGKYLFNGMGTKGTSLAPYWAEKLIDHLIDKTELSALVNPSRYSN